MGQNKLEELKPLESQGEIFKVIIGHEDVKRIFKMSLSSENPVHILLVGPPASAKTLFMLELMKLQRSYFTLGSHSTKSGLVDYLFAKRPRFLIIDEIEHMNTKDTTALLSLMQTGILSETKHEKTRSTQLRTWVFGSCNSTDKLPRPLLSRFLVLRFKKYSYDDFKKISNNVLIMDGIDPELADYVSDVVWGKMNSKDVRDSIKIARLAKNKKDVDWLVQTLKNYKR
ncbi:MAG TPA: AAA family ATPase [Nitrososphaerales archaeon]|nr:AAA family ATPase [Nitrososphaerales archaeon]